MLAVQSPTAQCKQLLNQIQQPAYARDSSQQQCIKCSHRNWRHIGAAASSRETPIDSFPLIQAGWKMDHRDVNKAQGEEIQLVSRVAFGKRRQEYADPPFEGTSTIFSSDPDASPQTTSQSPDLLQMPPPPRLPVGSSQVLPAPITLTAREALLYHHFTAHLGRWLDCTNASRLLTLRVTEMARQRPVLHHAVLCFSARHRGEDKTAGEAYQRCITLLIDRLDRDPSNDETLLTAVIILHFADQLNVRSTTGLSDKPHLSGSSGILRASQTNPFVDPSAPTVRDAIFWVYVRQSMYNATIRQQPLDLDFSLQLKPLPHAIQESHPLDWLRLETVWANQMLWYAANVANFCFAENGAQSGLAGSTQRWQELKELIETWRKNRPSSFDPIWAGPSTDDFVFPDIFFTADWHVISFTFYHFASILLLTYKPGPKFGMRIVQSEKHRSDIVRHAEPICSAIKSSPQNAQLLIILCHTVFIWGPLLSNPAKRKEVIRLLEAFENSHSWGTSWIINALRAEWGIG